MTVNYKDNKYHLLFNGEIYNFKELKNQISKKIKFQTTSDTEVLIKNFIFKKENPEFIMDFEGMFAFTIYNEKNNSIIFTYSTLIDTQDGINTQGGRSPNFNNRTGWKNTKFQ